MHRHTRYTIGVVAGWGLFAACAPASFGQTLRYDDTRSSAVFVAQRRPPEWAVGSFRGVNKKYKINMEVDISDSGTVRVRTSDDRGRGSRTSGSYRGGRIVVDGEDYRVEQIFRGIRLIQENDTSNVVNLSKFGGERGYDDPVSGRSDDDGDRHYRRPPEWALGTFRGYNRKYRNDVEMTVARDGRVTALLTERNGKETRQSGSYRNGKIELGNRTYAVDRSGSGIRMTEVGDRSHRIELTERGGRPGRDYDDPVTGGDGDRGDRYDRPPSWAVGTFEAHNERYNSDVEMTVSRDGRVTSRITDSNGKVTLIRGSYRNGRIEQDGKRYEVERTGRGLTLTETGNRSNRYTYRQVD